MLSGKRLALALAMGVSLAACNGGGNGLGSGSGAGSGNSTSNPVTENRDGSVYRQEIAVAATGDTMVVQVMEPTHLEKGQTYPLVLQGHGYGGSRNVEPTDFQQRLRDAGYYVISIDERGFGESSGTVRVMDPDFEGRDLIAIPTGRRTWKACGAATAAWSSAATAVPTAACTRCCSTPPTRSTACACSRPTSRRTT
jgi:ABC-2 type transport system ATP-binding protein